MTDRIDPDRIDPAFLALPLARLADAALGRARELGCRARRLPGRADRVAVGPPARRRRDRCRRRHHRGARGARGRGRRVGLRVARRPHAGTRGGDGGAGGRRRPRPGTAGSGAGRARPRAGVRRRRLGLGVRRRPVRGARSRRRSRCSPTGRGGCSPPGVDHVERGGSQVVQENKFYADLAGTPTTQQRVRAAAGVRGHGTVDADDRRLRLDAHARAAGRPRLGVPHRHRLGLGRRARASCPSCSPRSSRRRRSRPAATTWSSTRPTCGSPSTSRSATPPSSTGRSATRPTTPALVRHLRQARHACSTARRVMNVTGDRTVEHGLATSATTTRASPTSSGTSSRTASWSATSSTGRWPHHARAQRRPLQRLRVRRLPRPHPDPADGQRVAAAGAPTARRTEELIGRRRARHLRRRRQVLVDRHAALQLPVHRPAVLPDRGRPARRAAPRRRLPGAPPPTSGARWRPSAARRPACSAARSTAARPSPARSRAVSHGCPTALFRQVNVLNTTTEAS